MKLQIFQESFAKAINIASRFTTTRAQLPVLGNILLNAAKTKLNISSTNLEISVSISLTTKIEEEGEISIPSKVLAEFVGNLPKETLNLESLKEHLKISSSSFSSNILGMNSSDFPKVPRSINKEKSINIPRNELAEALNKTIFSSSIDETRPILTGVYFVIDKGELVLVATDGFRLSRFKLKTKINSTDSNFILPKGILSEIGRLDEVDNIIFEVQEKEKQVVFEVGSIIISSRLLEGEFPDYEKIIPKSSLVKITLDKEDLFRAVKLAAPFARDNSNILKLKTKKEELIVSAESSNAGNQETKIEARVEGESGEVSFNYKFLEDFLGSVDGNEVKIEFSGSDKAGVFFDTKDENYLHLIMPVRTQN